MRWSKYVENIQKDLKLFAIILGVLVLYRLYFMFYMSGYMADTTEIGDIVQASWAGLRISLKSAGVFTAFTFVFATLLNLFLPKINTDKIRLFVGGIAGILLSVLFQGRFPYYREYNMTYSFQVVQGANDDIQAIFVMLLEQYGLVWRLVVAIALSIIIYKLWKCVLKTNTIKIYSLEKFALPKKVFAYFLTLVITVGFSVFIRFGGSFNYEHSINWENAGVTSDAFLNECILDDIQALYRAKSINDKAVAGNITGVEKEKISELLKLVAGNYIEANSIEPYLKRIAQGARIEKPQHIFIIMGETLCAWPFMDKYAGLHVADELKDLLKKENCYFTEYFMPNGDFTSVAMTGIISGLVDINSSVNYQRQSFVSPYPTAFAPQLKKLGYEVNFWYGGIPSWDGMNKFAIAQGFDHYYGMPDFDAPKQSIWGTKDEYLFEGVQKGIKEDVPSVNIIMTTTNHPPYNLDLVAEGIDIEALKQATAKLENVENSEELAVELGHYLYMVKQVKNFISKTYAEHLNSIFIITGDHAVRMNPSNIPTQYEEQAVPFILYGKGITQDILPVNAVGGHISIMPTLIELIAPKGFEYYSLAPSMTDKTSNVAFNRTTWLTSSMTGQVDGDRHELIFDQKADYSMEKEKLKNKLTPQRTISWWLVQFGDSLEK